MCSCAHAAVRGASACLDRLLVACNEYILGSRGSDSPFVPMNVALGGLKVRIVLIVNLMWNNVIEELTNGDHSLLIRVRHR